MKCNRAKTLRRKSRNKKPKKQAVTMPPTNNCSVQFAGPVWAARGSRSTSRCAIEKSSASSATKVFIDWFRAGQKLRMNNNFWSHFFGIGVRNDSRSICLYPCRINTTHRLFCDEFDDKVKRYRESKNLDLPGSHRLSRCTLDSTTFFTVNASGYLAPSTRKNQK